MRPSLFLRKKGTRDHDIMIPGRKTMDPNEFRASIQKELTAGEASLAGKYVAIFPGRKGIWNLLKYEFITTFIAGMPGALGYLLRKQFFPRVFKEIGKGCAFGRNITFRHPHKIRIGVNSFIDDNAVLDAKGSANEGIVIGANAYIGRGAVLSCKEGSIIVGDSCNVSANCTLLSETEIRLGRYCFLAGNCYLVAGGNHSFLDVSTPIMFQPSLSKGGIQIGEDVWLGAGAIVLDGVTIGKSSVVGAGSVVTGPIPEYSFARGARQLKIQDRRNP
jgi:acetyltransferase-like isoleucine patch superfamily enzyme